MDATTTALTYLSAHRAEAQLGLGLFALSLFGNLAAVAFVLVRMPEDYLDTPEAAPFWPGRPAWARAAAKLGKNLLGVLLVALGVLLSLPGIPGQGVLTILIGVVLLDIPGKRRIERRLLGGPTVLAAVNRLRARFGRGPLHVSPRPPP
jgi:hypothetical protein